MSETERPSSRSRSHGTGAVSVEQLYTKIHIGSWRWELEEVNRYSKSV